MRTKGVLAGTLMSVTLAAAGLGLGTGNALAMPSQPHEWCPGMPMHSLPGPGSTYRWDMNVCHTWQRVKTGMGNVAHEVSNIDPVTLRWLGTKVVVDGSDVWDGPNMPPGAERDCGNDGFMGIPIPC
jgi:hypothetical protein